MPLLWVLRDVLDLKGTKFGCGIGAVRRLHGAPATASRCASCVDAGVGGRRDATITTIEGLSADGTHPLQQAWQEIDVPQCGYCQAGQIMSRRGAARAATPKPTDADIDARDERQPLPLRHLPAHPPGDSRAAAAMRRVDRRQPQTAARRRSE